ncbi:unnamed protein product [Linum tenue]|uniref:Uncharacterized protein n=1 Tax=Linum tenue TaxID=586396 RepID=A0AAV0GU53_9ROSI|nr:unnamed protein product [Linum tenue]
MDATTAIELLEAQPRVWDHCFSYVNAMTVQCAVELEIADAVHGHGKPISLGELAAALEISPAKAPFLSRLMRMLVHMAYFVEEEEEGGGYWVAPLGRFLLKDSPFNARSFVTCMNHPNLVDPWRHMSAWFRASENGVVEPQPPPPPPPSALAHGGKKLYEVCSSDPPFGKMFAEAMGGDSWLFSRALVAKCKEAFEGLSSLVDVGGSTGTTAKVIAEAFPGIHCTVFDLPHVVAAAEETHRSSNPISYVAGDMLTDDDIPQADALLFKWVLIDWPDERCLQVLKQCKKALTKNGGKGKVMIADHVLGHESFNDSSSLVFDLVNMACLEGHFRTEEQWSKLFSDAGFTNYTIIPVGGLRVLIQVYP